MILKIASSGTIAVVVLSLHTAALSANYAIDNPADKIKNPAATIYNPATDIKNPASNIYNPADRMNNPNPLSPVTRDITPPPVTKNIPAAATAESDGKKQLPPATVAVPHKKYHFKTVGAYISAAKKAFSRDDYREFLSLTEDALRRVRVGTLKASNKAQQTLRKYQVFGYGLLDKNGE